MTFVGALNVGSININFDKHLITNTSKSVKKPYYFDRNFKQESMFKNYQILSPNIDLDLDKELKNIKIDTSNTISN